jgi:hypothetical protein
MYPTLHSIWKDAPSEQVWFLKPFSRREHVSSPRTMSSCTHRHNVTP